MLAVAAALCFNQDTLTELSRLYYSSRAAIGKALAQIAPRPSHAPLTVVCLKPRSMPTCEVLARCLGAEVVQLAYEPVLYPGDATRVIGAMLPGGGFCRHPNASESELRYIASELAGPLAEAQRMALRRLRHDADMGCLTDGAVLLAADILTDRLPIAVAGALLKHCPSAHMYGIAANITAEAGADLQRMCSSMKSLHRLQHGLFDDEHYIGDSSPRLLHPARADTYAAGLLRIPARHLLCC